MAALGSKKMVEKEQVQNERQIHMWQPRKKQSALEEGKRREV